MFSQLFGKYLIESDIISEEQYEDILASRKNSCKAYSLIAVSEVSPEGKAERINILQTQKDARFGDIAVEEDISLKNSLI